VLLGFKDRFEPMVLDGSKTHSIREGDRWRVGFRADLYVRPRQKDMRLLFRAPVVRVETVEIWMRSASILGQVVAVDQPVYCGIIGIAIAGETLTDDEANLLAWNDGFRTAGPVRRAPAAIAQAPSPGRKGSPAGLS